MSMNGKVEQIEQIARDIHFKDKFVFCNFSHIIPQFLEENFPDKIGNCRTMSSIVSKRLFDIGVENKYIEDSNKHVCLALFGQDGEKYILDPYLGQKQLMNVDGGKSDSFQSGFKLSSDLGEQKLIITRVDRKRKKIKFLEMLKRETGQYVYDILELKKPENIEFSRCKIAENPKMNLYKSRLNFFLDNGTKVSIKYLGNLEIFELRTVDTNKQFRKGKIKASDLEYFEKYLGLDKNTFLTLFAKLDLYLKKLGNS